jgi:3-oxoacyl-[acyl-carrier-protein] synthase-1
MTTIQHIGLVSSLGLDAATSLAAARAGLVRAAPLRTVNPASEDFLGGAPVNGHSLACGESEGFVGPAKALLLGRLALTDLLASAGELNASRTACFVVLSNQFIVEHGAPPEEAEEADPEAPRAPTPSEAWREQTAQFMERLLANTVLAGVSRAEICYGGHASVIEALSAAERALASGAVDSCVIGAIDSCVEPRFMRAAAAGGLLKCEKVPDGFIPGEAGAFIVVSGSTGEGLARISAVGAAHDARHAFAEEPADGVGLATAIGQCFERLPTGERVGLIISDLNGDTRRAMEWGYAQVRLRRRRLIDDAPMWLPAASFGETGCAAGVVAICAAVRALGRGYANGRNVLVVLSSDDGLKGALCVSA